MPRWTIARLNRPQYVDSHSYFVTLYGLEIARHFEWKGDHAALARKLIWHDQDEGFGSDIPGPTKRHICDPVKKNAFIVKGMKERFGVDWRHRAGYKIKGLWPAEVLEANLIQKAADLLDEVFYLAGEHQMGNASIEHYYNNALKRLETAWFRLPFDPMALAKGWIGVERGVSDNGFGLSQMVTNDDDLAI